MLYVMTMESDPYSGIESEYTEIDQPATSDRSDLHAQAVATAMAKWGFEPDDQDLLRAFGTSEDVAGHPGLCLVFAHDIFSVVIGTEPFDPNEVLKATDPNRD